MTMKRRNRFLCLLLTTAMLLGMCPMGTLALESQTVIPETTLPQQIEILPDDPISPTRTAAEYIPLTLLPDGSEGTVILAGSDFQPTDGSTDTGTSLMNDILEEVYQAYPSLDGLLFGGDYNYDYDEAGCIAGKEAVQAAVADKFGTVSHQVYIQGNHDPDAIVGSTLSASGANDPASGAYGVFVINEKDYMWYNNDPAVIQSTAASLDTYLSEKISQGYDQPVFVISHLPLHYCLRTQVGGDDGKYAKYLFDVLQEAGAQDLNIIFLYGHNHSHGWDDPYGGAAVYLQPGQNINIAKTGSTTEYTQEALEFTYMNAGFVSYYRDVNEGADTSLTMTVFVIQDGQVAVQRFDANGQHNLKSAGVLNSSHHSGTGTASCCSSRGTETYDPDTSIVYEDEIPLTTPVANTTVWSTDGDISVTAQGLTEVTYTGGQAIYTGSAYTLSYTVTPGSYTGAATVTLDLPSAFSAAALSQLAVTGGRVKSWDGDILTLEVSSFPAQVDLTYTVSSAGGWALTLATPASLDALESGTYILIPFSGTTAAMTSTASVSKNNAFDKMDVTVNAHRTVTYVSGMENTVFWEITKTGDNTVTLQAPNGQYLNIGSANQSATLSDTPQDITVSIDGGVVFQANGQYLDYFSSNGQVFSTWGNDSVADNNRFYLYRASDTVTTGSWVQISESSDGSYYSKVNSTDQLADGETYVLIYDASQDMYVTRSTVTKNQRTGLDVVSADWTGDPADILEYDLTDYEWVFTQSGGQWYVSYGDQALAFTSESSSRAALGLAATGEALTVADSGTFTFSGSTYVFDYSSKGVINGYVKTPSAKFYIYRKLLTEATETEYAKLAGEFTFAYTVGTDAATVAADILSRITVFTGDSDQGEGTPLTDLSQITFGSLDTATADTSLVTVSYKGVAIGRVSVTIAEKQVAAIAVNSMTGTVQRGGTAVENAVLTVTYTDGGSQELPLLVSYLSGTELDTGKNGTYENLTVHYGGQTLSGYTLTVIDRAGNNFPDYPSPGAVTVSKTGEGMDFQNTGLARIELSASGIPSASGIDLVIVVDTSSSMDQVAGSSSQRRIDVLSASLANMLTQLSAENAFTGERPDIDLAVISFNGYSTPISSAQLTDTARNDQDTSRIYTGAHANEIIPDLYNSGYRLSAADFIQLDDSSFTSQSIATLAGYFNQETTTSGTNYDAGLMNAYTLLAAKKAANAEPRQQIVVFLSDGAPFRYNGFTQGAENPYTLWNKWLTGTWSDSQELTAEVPRAATYSYFYNGNGQNHPHRIAEAIKGSPTQEYTVVDRLNSAGTPAYTSRFFGLDAAIFSIGFCLAEDKGVTVETEQEVLMGISSGQDYHFFVNSAEELNEAFSNIAGTITYAATDAVFTDKMGDRFELQLAASTRDSQGNSIDAQNDIHIKTYPIYNLNDVADGLCTAEDVGKAYGEGTVIETITFNADGTQAYSSVLGADVNILTDGKINAANLTYDLAEETFFWNIGTVNELQYTLSYTVYLSNSMNDPGVPEGSYDTNLYARLDYVNFLGNTVYQSVPSPTLPWRAANVRYAFYLVDENGTPLTANGKPASGIHTAYKVTSPVLYQTILFNTSDTSVPSHVNLALGDVAPMGYRLYDADAAYSVSAYSGGGGSWSITKGEGKVDSTYVTRYNDSGDFSNAASSTSQTGYDYSHTIVYFAVQLTVSAVNDTVVIDYGLPVDIDVLYNDLFKGLGTLAGIGSTLPDVPMTDTLDTDAFQSSWQGQYGNAELVDRCIRYTPQHMQMATSEQFVYAVNYTEENNSGYYYGSVTVIPATSIYYEDSFLTFGGAGLNGNEAPVWTQVGSYDGDGLQAQDRPGSQSLPVVDANNIYGYDDAYSDMATYSLGTAHKVTVTEKIHYATASFTFTGTGFDVISMTGGTTGGMMVTVRDPSGAIAWRKLVDTYYGYHYNEDSQSWVLGIGDGALYQVPVIKCENLTYGTYSVELRIGYDDLFYHNQDGQNDITATDNRFDFYLDAIRIYDPAYDGATDADVLNAYIQDNEGWPSYYELRSRILTTNSFTGGADSSCVNGVIYIDGKGAATIADYTSYGPNNEVYLTQGNALAFTLGLQDLSNVADVQIGIKSADGKPVTVSCFNVTQDQTLRLNEASRSVNSSTELYYSAYTQCTADPNAIIVLQNTGEGILSITNIKITYKSNPGTSQAVFQVSPTAVQYALDALDAGKEG